MGPSSYVDLECTSLDPLSVCQALSNLHKTQYNRTQEIYFKSTQGVVSGTREVHFESA